MPRQSPIRARNRSSLVGVTGSRIARPILERVAVIPIVTRVGRGPTARSRLRYRAAASCRPGVVALCLTLVAAITAMVVGLSRPAAADEISDLKAQAAQVAQQLIYEQLQVGGYEQQYALATEKLERDALAISHTEQQVLEHQRSIEQDRTRLRKEAIFDYTSSAANGLGGVQQLFGGNEKTVAIQAEYTQLASADVLNSIDRLRIAEGSLRSTEAILQRQQALDQATTSQAAMLTEQANDTQAQLQALETRVTGQLATAVAQQQAAQAAAAAAAVRAQEAISAGSAPIPGAQLVSDPVLPPFLQCVKQAESGGNYGAVSPGGTYMGAFQFSQATWNEAALLAGLPGLVGVPPNEASPAEQDALAVALYDADGDQPWYDPCRSAGSNS
jgi:Transglycosylase-like domain